MKTPTLEPFVSYIMKKVVVLYVSYLSNILADISVAKATRCII